jgi:hypothetical protein
MSVTAATSGGGFELVLELQHGDLLPGRLTDGVVRLTAGEDREIRGARVTLVGTETWRYDVTTTDAQGQVHTRTRTATSDLPHVPIAILSATAFTAGESRDVPFQVPVPELGPPSFDGTELRMDWALTLNVDVPGFDPSLVMPVRVLQPTALLRAGVIDVAEFALYPEAAVAVDGLAGTIRLDPVPLVIGAPFSGRLDLATGPTRRVEEVRLELRVVAVSTVGGGRQEEITLWSDRLADAGEFGGPGGLFPFSGILPDRQLPTMRTPHGRADARFHVVVAVPWGRDPHLVRDVAICSTTEV